MHAAFRICSRAVVATYGRFPVFGELRSSIALIRRGDEHLLQRRADDLGWAFPGGMALFWETDEQTLRREVREETGLPVVACRLLFVYHTRLYLPSRVSVYEAEVDASQALRGSWEGEPHWMRLEPAPQPFFEAQREVLAYAQERQRNDPFPEARKHPPL